MYFTKEFIDFFKGLAANNTKEYFHDNKKLYDNYVKKPFQQLVLDLLDATDSKAELKHCMFRINRDIRFSNDKSPYKLHMGAVISDGGRKDMQIPGLYLHLSAYEQSIGGGMYMPEKDNLMKIRRAIIADPNRFEKMLKNKSFTKLFGTIKGERNKILPKELKGLADDNEWVYNKQYYFMANYKDEKIPLKDDLFAFILEHHAAGREFNDYFAELIA